MKKKSLIKYCRHCDKQIVLVKWMNVWFHKSSGMRYCTYPSTMAKPRG